tara:strand:- start:1653 stop:1931 length:279 start_codon:yes stop_codon:yes gene_type:complete
MPIYTFKNKKTNEVYDKIMTYDELQLYVKDKDIEQIFKINITRYSDNGGYKDQFTDWAASSKIDGKGDFNPQGKAKTDDDKRNEEKNIKDKN